MKYTSVLCTLFIFAFCSTVSQAQVVTQPMKSDVAFQINVPVIQTFPPLQPWMPRTVTHGYLYFDSLCSTTTREAIDSITSTYTNGDTLTYPVKLLYEMDDYDPVTFNQWLHITPSLAHYKTAPGYVYLNVMRQVAAFVTDTQRTAMVWGPDYIARVKINSVQTFDSATAPQFHGQIIVGCQVLDTIKGIEFPPKTQTFTAPSKESSESGATNDLRFLYAPAPPRKLPPQGTIDSLKIRLRDNFRNPSLAIGREYMVFLSVQFLGNDSTTFVMTMEPTKFKFSAGGLYPIQNGIVEDPDNDFGFGANLPVSSFIAAIRNRIVQQIRP
jgi:hypothetical protein